MALSEPAKKPRVSIAVRAWNEEKIIRRTLNSLFGQSLFAELHARGEVCEVICIPNGCTDQTATVAAAVFAEQTRWHPFTSAFTARVAEMERPGRNSTWNSYVHKLSAPSAEFLFIMDSDILFYESETLFNMYAALLNDSEAYISTDRQIKDVALKPKKTLIDRLSLATTNMTRTIEAQITGQLYCIRSNIARRLWLPEDLGAPDDGFIKAVVCTDFFSQELNPKRIVAAQNASHIYEAYTSPREILNNQKRQMIGQTTVHVLIQYIQSLPYKQRANLAATLKRKEEKDPKWLRKLTNEHLKQHRHFWELFPNLLTFRFRRWWKLRGVRRLTHFPAVLAGFATTLAACALASRHFRRGEMHYWPKASRTNLQRLGARST